jgi:hypothetical protein
MSGAPAPIVIRAVSPGEYQTAGELVVAAFQTLDVRYPDYEQRMRDVTSRARSLS